MGWPRAKLDILSHRRPPELAGTNRIAGRVGAASQNGVGQGDSQVSVSAVLWEGCRLIEPCWAPFAIWLVFESPDEAQLGERDQMFSDGVAMQARLAFDRVLVDGLWLITKQGQDRSP